MPLKWPEKTDDDPPSAVPKSATVKPHGKVKSVLERKHSISFTTIATAVGISPASTYSILTNSLGKRKVCAKCVPYLLKDDQIAMRVLATTHLRRWRKESIAFLDHI
jgi:hypothetical protein